MPSASNGRSPGPGDRVLVTGASSGIGLATAVAYARRGARVALLARSEAGLAEAARQVLEAGGEPHVLPADVTRRQELQEAVGRAAAALGGLDVAVHAAAAASYGTFEETDPDDFDRTVSLVLVGSANVIRSTLPLLEESAGTLVVVGSVAGRIPLPMLAAYTAAKHGLRGLVDVLRVELGERRSTVHLALVSPGPVDTPFWHNVAVQADRLPPPLPGSYRPEEVAAAVLECADRRHAGRTVGGLVLAAQAVHSLAGPLTERFLGLGLRLARNAGEAGRGAAAIRGPAGAGRTRSGLAPARPSLYVRGVQAAGALAGAARRAAK